MSKQEPDPFIDDSIRKEWIGEPIEWEKPTFRQPHGLTVREITWEEFQAARDALEKDKQSIPA